MSSSEAKSLRWVWWIFPIIFIGIAVIIDWKWLPPDHWSRDVLYFGAALLSHVCTTLLLRRKGLSQESLRVEAWPNERRSRGIPVVVQDELRYPLWHWVYVLMCVFLVVGSLYIYLFVPADQQRGREWALPLIVLFSSCGIFMCYCFSQPIMRVGLRGISGAFSRLIRWEDITGCRSVEQRNAQGDVTGHSIEVLGRMGNLITKFEIAGAPAEERTRFCQMIKRALAGL